MSTLTASTLATDPYAKDVSFAEFASLIAPCGVDEFFHKYYEKTYLYIDRNDCNYYDTILNTDDIDQFFQNKSISSSDLKVVKNGETVPKEKWANIRSGFAINDKVLGLFNEGYTVVVDQGHRSILKLTNYRHSLERELGIRLQFNLYITPLSAQGFSPHFDNHDVLILQTTGTKTWRLYNSPVELASQKFNHSDYKDEFELEEPAFQVTLKPGDFLYVPRGLVHDAITSRDASVHITLGLHPNYWFELLQEWAKLAEDMPEFRRAITHGFKSEEDQRASKAEFLQLTQALVDQLDVDALLERQIDQYIVGRPSEDKNRFNEAIRLNQLNLNSILRKRENVLFKMECRDGQIYVKFSGKTLEFDLLAEPSLKTLVQPECFAIKDIGGFIIDQGRIELATQFVREGFLTIVDINAEH